MTREAFVAIVSPLALALRAEVDQGTWGAYYQVLGSVSDHALLVAVASALRECRYFPTPAELLSHVDRARTRLASQAALPVVASRAIEPLEIAIPHTDRRVTVTAEYQHECEACADSGWRPMWCGRRDTLPFVLADRGVRPNQCGRAFDHAPHEFAVECTCRPTNRTYQRKREQECASARKRTERDGR